MTSALLDEPRPAAVECRPATRRGQARSASRVHDRSRSRTAGRVSAAVPLVYLVVRVWELGWTETWAIASSARTREVLVDTLVLAGAVTVAAVVISVPLAWLTTRTDLPGRRIWVVVTALPLAIPTYVGAFAMIGALGPRGMVQGWLEPLGVEELPRSTASAGRSSCSPSSRIPTCS